jgi:hypothetical protein
MKKMAFYEVVSKDCDKAIRIRVSFRASLRALRRVSCVGDLSQCEVFNNFETAVARLEADALREIISLKKESEFELFEQKLHSVGICEDNAFLFVRGHSIFDATIKAYAAVSEKFQKEEIVHVELAFKHSGIQALDDQVRGVKKSWVAVGETLKHNFYACRPEVPFLNEARFRLASDYKQASSMGV